MICVAQCKLLLYSPTQLSNGIFQFDKFSPTLLWHEKFFLSHIKSPQLKFVDETLVCGHSLLSSIFMWYCLLLCNYSVEVDLAFKSVYKTLVCDHSNESH